MCHKGIVNATELNSYNDGVMNVEDVFNLSDYSLKNGSVTFNYIVDLTYLITPDFPTFFGDRAYKEKIKKSYHTDGLNLEEISYSEHVGTHIDAPIHFSSKGQFLNEIKLEQLICPLVIINVEDKCKLNRDYRLTQEDILEHENKYGLIPENACVVMNSGWGKYINGTIFRGEDSDRILHFPGFDNSAAKFLLSERIVSSIGIDTLSIDYGMSTDSVVHKTWLSTGRFAFECLANLDSVPQSGGFILIGPPKFEQMTGGPSRVFACFNRM